MSRRIIYLMSAFSQAHPIDPAGLSCIRERGGERTIASLSTPFGQKNAPNSAQEDSSVVGRSFAG
jgi:hypothetical protein